MCSNVLCRQRQVKWGQTAWGRTTSEDPEAGGDAGLSSGRHGVWEAQVSFKEPPAFRDRNSLDCQLAYVTVGPKNVFCASCGCSLICEDTAIQEDTNPPLEANNPPLPHTHTHTHTPHITLTDSPSGLILRNQRDWFAGKEEMEKVKRCVFSVGWADCHLPRPHDYVCVSNREWRTLQSPTPMKSSQFIHGINEPPSPTWQVAITRMDGGERQRQRDVKQSRFAH